MHGEVLGGQCGDLAGQGRHDARVRGPRPQPPPDVEGVAVRGLVGQEREQLRRPAFPDQLPLDPQVQGQSVEDLGADRVGEGVGVGEEGLVEVLVALGERLHEQPEVSRERVLVVAPLRLGHVAVGEETAHRGDRRDPVADAPGHRAPGGDRAVAVPPVVDRLLHDVDAPRQEMGRQDHRDVLVQDTRREGEGVLVPEGPAEHLVARDAVAEQDPVPGDVGGPAGPLHRPAEHRGLFEQPVRPEPEDVARREVRSGGVEFAEHPGEGARRHDVVAVHERQEPGVRVRLPGPRVACRPESPVLLPDQPEARVTPGELQCHVGTSVRRAVVDHDDLQIGHGLSGERLQAGSEVLLDVVERDDDGETGCHDAAHDPSGRTNILLLVERAPCQGGTGLAKGYRPLRV